MANFDAFLAHNSLDKPLVKEVKKKLENFSLKQWLDEEQIYGGDTPLIEIQKGISQSKSVVFFIGSHGTGRWQGNLELPTIVTLVIESNLRLIPVLLPGVQTMPDDSSYLFLKTKSWINFQSIDDAEALDKLFMSITKSKELKIPEQPVNEIPKMSPKDDTTLEKLLIKPLELLNSHLDYTSNTSANQAKEIIQSYTNIQLPIDTDDLRSEKGIDYSKLRYLLAAQNWEEADKETYEVMIKAVGKKSDEWFTSDELLNFPCQDIRTIDQLWVNYSNGRFGFSVQKEIYLSVGGEFSSDEYDFLAWNMFVQDVGWYDVHKNQIPRGHLPFSIYGRVFFLGDFQSRVVCIFSLVSRLVNCNI